MQSKMDAISAPVSVLMGTGFLSMNFWMDEGLPFLALLANVLLAAVGILVMFNKWRLGRVELKRAKYELAKDLAGDDDV